MERIFNIKIIIISLFISCNVFAKDIIIGPHQHMPDEEFNRLRAQGKASLPSVESEMETIDWDIYFQASCAQPRGDGIIGVTSKIIKDDISGDALNQICTDIEQSSTTRRIGLMAGIEWSKTKNPRIIKALMSSCTDQNPMIHEIAVSVLSKLDIPENIPSLKQLCADEKDERIRCYAAAGLARMNDEQGLNILINNLNHPDIFVRDKAATLLRGSKDPRALTALEQAARKETNLMVQAVIFGSLQILTGKTDRELRKQLLGREW